MRANAYDDTGAAFLESFVKTSREIDERCRQRCQQLVEEYNVVTVHPDDGWIDRNKDGTAYRCILHNPDWGTQQPRIGDLIALTRHNSHRIYKVVSAKTLGFITSKIVRYHIEPAE